ncbi:MAG: MBL fold metallo-hydrolase [Gaiellaceae bacterium]
METSPHFRLEQVAEGAWAAIAVPSGAAVANAGIVALDDGALVFDTFFTPAAGEDLRAAAERLAGPVRFAVLSHAHLDHWGGAPAFAGAEVLASSRTAAAIAQTGQERVDSLRAEAPGYVDELEGKLAAAPAGATAARLRDDLAQAHRVVQALFDLRVPAPTRTFDTAVELGGGELRELGSGHSASDSVLWLARERVLFAGDLVVVDTHPSLSHGVPDEWLRILGELRALDPGTVVPGHGPVGGASEIDAVAAYIRRLRDVAGGQSDAELPGDYRTWAFPEVFEQNLEFLRARAGVRT